RSLIRIVAVSALLLIPAIWTARQSRLAQEATARAIAAEQAANQARADAEQARGQVQDMRQPARDEAVARARASRHNDPKEVERVRQLYQEIEGLTHLQGHVADRLQGLRTLPKTEAAQPQTGAP